ncbi:MAG: SDR family oxidoreductase [Spirochaetes bacterium]|nr:SDR family oxidoreductase [Spirochaetota bacterium]
MNDMNGRTCVVTGATSGIGFETALILARSGARLIGVGRDPARCSAAAARIRDPAPGADVRFEIADLSSQAEVRSLAARIRDREPRLDVLVNNAGLFTFRRAESADGIEMQLAVNHLAGFLLTHELMPLLEAAPRARVVFVSSGSHFHGRIRFADPGRRCLYSGLSAYEQSKLAVLMTSVELARRLGPGSTIDTFAVDPGLVRTEIGAKDGSPIVRWVWGLRAGRGIDAREAAASVVWLAMEPSIEGATGRYWKERQVVPSSRRSTDPEACRRLWDLSDSRCENGGLHPRACCQPDRNWVHLSESA